MATRTGSRSSSSSNTSGSTRDRSAFSWGSAGGVVGAALGGAALAIAANLGRKLATQGMSAAAGNWADSLAAEHKAVEALFDKMLATDDDQVAQRALYFMKLSHALDKHAYAEEHVVYPALREANQEYDADLLEKEHGEVKTYLYKLSHLAKGSPEWLPTIREFRDAVVAHAKMEESEVFPKLREGLDDELDQRITREVNKAGFMMA